MPSPSTIVRAALVAGVASAASIERRQMVTDSCAEVHIFLAKGNNEPYPGRQGVIVSAVCEGLESCDYEDIQMRNMLSDPYCTGINDGVKNGRDQIIAYNQRCPDSKLVISGFSQGAHVAGDILGGGGGSFFQDCQGDAVPNLAFNTPAGQAIAAVVTFGDVRHSANQPYNYLAGATKWGYFPRNAQQLANALDYTNVWRDYCNGEDSVCAGGNSVEEHLDYFERYTPEVADYIHQKLREAGLGSKPTTSAIPVGPSTTAAGSAPFPTASVPHGNGTAPETVITVTDGTVTLTYYTTVCPITDVYVPNPTGETKPATHPPVTETCLPEGTVPVPSDASSTPIVGTSTIPGVIVPTASGNGTVPVPTSSLPAGSGSAANMAKVGGAFAAAALAVAALL